MKCSFLSPLHLPPGAKQIPLARRCLLIPQAFVPRPLSRAGEGARTPQPPRGHPCRQGPALPGMLRGRQEVTAGCAPRRRAWRHPVSHLGGPWWPPVTIALTCHPTATFCPSLGATHGTGPGPSCPQRVPSWHPATSTACRLCTWTVPPACAPPGTPPDADLHPAPMGPRRQRGTSHIPIAGTPQKKPKRIFCVFCRNHWPQEPIRWLFIYIPKATLITPRGGITSGSFFLGQKVGGKKSFEQSNNPSVTEGTPASGSNHQPC